MRLRYFLLLLLLPACEQPVEVVPKEAPSEEIIESELTYPVEGFEERRTFKVFGQFVDDRFYGYHVGDDIEFGDTEEEVPVVAMADGTVEVAKWVSGYGGVMILRHEVDGVAYHAIYGHVDLSSLAVEVGDLVMKGQFLANLGDGESTETDGERKHLHFGLYEGEEIRYSGYVQSESELSEWVNPSEFFNERVDLDHQ